MKGKKQGQILNICQIAKEVLAKLIVLLLRTVPQAVTGLFLLLA